MTTTMTPLEEKLDYASTRAFEFLYDFMYHDDCYHQDGLEGWTFGFDNAKTRAGQCDFGRRRITLSRLYVEHASFEEIDDVILHEIAHAIAGFRAGHGPVWKRVARSIGCNAERCADMPASMPKGRYEAVCDQCGADGLGWRWQLTEKLRTRAVHNQNNCYGRISWKDHG